jgi:hypothetical protein
MSAASYLDRRRFLLGSAAGLAAAAVPLRAHGVGPSSKFRFAQLQLGTSWNPRPSALRRMAWELEKRTSIEVALDPVVTPLTHPAMHETPFLYLAGDRELPMPSAQGLETLRRFLTFGGFLLVDSAEGTTGGAFDQSVRKLLGEVFPGGPGLEIVPSDHVIHRSFYLLERPVGRLAIAPTMEGMFRDGRMVVAYVQNDLAGAWARDNFGNYEFPCDPGGEPQRELAFRVGVNIVMYALCLDYKSDQVHVPFIMRRRRWRPNDGATIPSKKP